VATNSYLENKLEQEMRTTPTELDLELSNLVMPMFDSIILQNPLLVRIH
jgi:hypothetical protein